MFHERKAVALPKGLEPARLCSNERNIPRRKAVALPKEAEPARLCSNERNVPRRKAVAFALDH
jgi:hypothetical protein